jgi:hypothetical protein
MIKAKGFPDKVISPYFTLSRMSGEKNAVNKHGPEAETSGPCLPPVREN